MDKFEELRQLFVEAVMKELENTKGDSADKDSVEQQLDDIFDEVPELDKVEQELFGESANTLSEEAFSDKLKKFAALVAFCVIPFISTNADAATIKKGTDGGMDYIIAEADSKDLIHQIAALEKGMGEHVSLSSLATTDGYFKKKAKVGIFIEKGVVLVRAKLKATKDDGALRVMSTSNFQMGGDGLSYEREFSLDNKADLAALTKFVKFSKNSLTK